MRELKLQLLLDVSVPTLCKFLRRSGFTRQRLHTVALQQDKVLRQQFSLDISVHSREMFVFIDESGADKRNIKKI